MPVDKKLLHKLADMSKIHICKEEEDGMIRDLNKVISWMGIIQEVDTEGVTLEGDVVPAEAALRDDVAQEPANQTDALKNAPEQHDGFFIVPKFVD